MDKASAFAITFWAVIIIAIISVAFLGIRFVCVKTSSAISSCQEWNQERKESKAAEKEIRVKERAVAKEKRAIATKKAEKEKAAAAEKRKVEAAIKEKPVIPVGEDEEFGDLMFNADGSLRDPSSEDAYTASQTYWILALFILGFFIWVGVSTRTAFGVMLSVLMSIAAIILAIIVWSW